MDGWMFVCLYVCIYIYICLYARYIVFADWNFSFTMCEQGENLDFYFVITGRNVETTNLGLILTYKHPHPTKHLFLIKFPI